MGQRLETPTLIQFFYEWAIVDSFVLCYSYTFCKENVYMNIDCLIKWNWKDIDVFLSMPQDFVFNFPS